MLKGTRSIFYAAYRSWRERRQRGELWRFSRKPPREDPRSRLARLVDLCGTLLLVWISSLFLLNIFGAGLLAPFAATGLTVLTGAMAARFRQKRFCAELRQRPDKSQKNALRPFPYLLALKRAALRQEKARSYLLAGTFLLACRFLLGPELPASSLYLLLAAANMLLGLACLVCGEKKAGPSDRYGLQEP